MEIKDFFYHYTIDLNFIGFFIKNTVVYPPFSGLFWLFLDQKYNSKSVFFSRLGNLTQPDMRQNAPLPQKSRKKRRNLKIYTSKSDFFSTFVDFFGYF